MEDDSDEPVHRRQKRKHAQVSSDEESWYHEKDDNDNDNDKNNDNKNDKNNDKNNVEGIDENEDKNIDLDHSDDGMDDDDDDIQVVKSRKRNLAKQNSPDSILDSPPPIPPMRERQATEFETSRMGNETLKTKEKKWSEKDDSDYGDDDYRVDSDQEDEEELEQEQYEYDDDEDNNKEYGQKKHKHKNKLKYKDESDFGLDDIEEEENEATLPLLKRLKRKSQAPPASFHPKKIGDSNFLDNDYNHKDDDNSIPTQRPKKSRKQNPFKRPSLISSDYSNEYAVDKAAYDSDSVASEENDQNYEYYSDDNDFVAGDDDDDDFIDDESDADFKNSTWIKGRAKKRKKKIPRPRRTITPAINAFINDNDSVEDNFSSDWEPSGRKKALKRKGVIKKARATESPSYEWDEPKVRERRRNTGVNYAKLLGDESSDDSMEKKKSQVQTRLEEFESPVLEKIIESVLTFRNSPDKDASENALAGSMHSRLSLYKNFDPDTAQFLIKWIRTSYRRCSWHTELELSYFKGYRKVTNFSKRISDLQYSLLQDSTTAEETEDFLIQDERSLEDIREYHEIGRIVSDREIVDGQQQYLVKWKNLQYAECTWENSSELSSSKDLEMIDEYLVRKQNANTQSGLSNPFGAIAGRKPFKQMTEQPEWLHVGVEKGSLRDYQMIGLNWLAYNWCHGRNAILADEMGLGKTLQTICFIGWQNYEKKVRPPFLVVVPLSTIAAWEREFQKWLPELNVIVYIGDGFSREIIRKYEFQNSNSNNVNFQVLITTPEIILFDADHLSAFRWSCVAVDEAHRLKNDDSALYKTLLSFQYASCLLVTGTPLQNSMRELWALLNFLHPGEFGSAESFETIYSFDALVDPEVVASLHKEVRPYIIRRQKQDVEKSLPKKSYSAIRVGMTGKQKEIYKWILTRNFTQLQSEILKGKSGKSAGLLNIVVELKKCCNHPLLISEEESYTLNSMIIESGKMILLDKLLTKLKERGHRVLIFSQMVKMLNLLEDYCKMRGFPCQKLDGSMPNQLRQRAVDHYNAPGSPDFVFLLSTRAGGLGINLATADTVIIFDSDWNPQNDLQAESRAHRIGQKRDVKVFRLLSRDTIEEDILERAKRKRILEHLVIQGVQNGTQGSKKGTAFKSDELSAILRFGAEQLFKNEQLQAQGKIANEKPDGNVEMDDIDELLDRVSEKNDEGLDAEVNSFGESILNAFKWSDFNPDEQIDEVSEEIARKAAKKLEDTKKRNQKLGEQALEEVEKEKDHTKKESDKAFWERVIPGNVKSEILAAELNLGPRKRNAVKNYGGDDDDEDDNEMEAGAKPNKRGSRKPRNTSSSYELAKKDYKNLIKAFKNYGRLEKIEDILRDCDLQGTLDVDEGKALLENMLINVCQVCESKADAVDGKKSDLDFKIEFGGELFNAKDIYQRYIEIRALSEQIAECTEDIRFRINALKLRPPQFSNRWTIINDSMLLVGIYRHGIGNWGKIQEDADLQLCKKMHIAEGDPPNAPDSAKLLRRVQALLKSVYHSQLENRVSKPKNKKKESGKNKEKPQTENKSSTTKSKAKVPTKEIKQNDLEHKRMFSSLFRSHKETFQWLQRLSTDEAGELPKKAKIKQTKECLITIGDAIREFTGSNQELNSILWEATSRRCQTAYDGNGLNALYEKVKESA